MKKVKQILGIVIVSLVTIGIGLCSNAQEISAAETLRILQWGDYIHDYMIPPFCQYIKTKYGVDLTLELRSVGPGLSDEFFPALRDGTADLITPDHSVLQDKQYQFIKQKLILPLNLENIPNYQYVIPGLYKADYCTVDGKVYASPIAMGPYGLAYNTDLLPNAPDSWTSLWDPQFQKRYVVGDVLTNVFIAALALGFNPEDLTAYQKMNTAVFQEKLAQLAANADHLWQEYDKPEDLKGMTLAASYKSFFKGDSKAWKLAVPKEGTPTWVDHFVIGRSLSDKPQLKQIAEELINYTLSIAYQEHDIQDATEPVTTSIREKLTPEEIALLHLDDPTYFAKHRFLIPVMDKRGRQEIQRLWDKSAGK